MNKNLYVNVNVNSIIHNSLKVEITQMSTDGWTNKYDIIQP